LLLILVVFKIRNHNALIKVSGQLSDRAEKSFRVAKKKTQSQLNNESKPLAVKMLRKITGIRGAEARAVAPKLLPEADLKLKGQLELESARNCYVWQNTLYTETPPFL
jgi:hypothetical protein